MSTDEAVSIGSVGALPEQAVSLGKTPLKDTEHGFFAGMLVTHGSLPSCAVPPAVTAVRGHFVVGGA